MGCSSGTPAGAARLPVALLVGGCGGCAVISPDFFFKAGGSDGNVVGFCAELGTVLVVTLPMAGNERDERGLAGPRGHFNAAGVGGAGG